MERVFGEGDGVKAGAAAPSARPGYRPLSPPGVGHYLLDTAYLGGLAFAIPYLFATGKGHRVFEHIPRRSRDIPQRHGSRPCLWVHGVSVGEILSARRFLKRFAEEFPDWEALLSTTTRAGLEVARRHYPGVQVVSYPFDLSYLVRRAFDRIRPDLVLIVEHELWPNFLWHAEASGVPVAVVNGRLSERSLRGYRWLSRLVRWPPPGIVTFCVEDELSADGFRRLGVPAERIHVTGNFKFDNAPRPAGGSREELGLCEADWVLVAASTHTGEEEILLDSYGALHREDSRSRLILAPRHVERVEELEGLVRRKGFEAFRWSRLAAAPRNEGGPGGPASWQQNGHGQVLIVDTMGELDRISTAGDVVFVGGSLVPFGGHNVIAPAGMGLPVVIGPHHANFRSVVAAFQSRDALCVVKDGRDLSRKLCELKKDPARARQMARRAIETVSAHAGASERTLEVLRPLIEERGRGTVREAVAEAT
ncbi:MAG: 3-deoxy-D-manno-octulosonic acid transferase [Planctomycetes bacterium]|nr:3-deoxy-D-manno-octulosonic acid transferase [Planctomycetota bacterium]